MLAEQAGLTVEGLRNRIRAGWPRAEWTRPRLSGRERAQRTPWDGRCAAPASAHGYHPIAVRRAEGGGWCGYWRTPEGVGQRMVWRKCTKGDAEEKLDAIVRRLNRQRGGAW